MVVWLSLVGFVQKFFGFGLWVEYFQGIANERVMSVYDYPNALGLVLAPIVGGYFVLLLSKLFSERKNYIHILGYLGVFILGSISLVLAQSEGALIGLSAGVGLSLFLYNKKTRIGVVAVGFLVVGYLVFNQVLFQNIMSRVMFQDFSGQIRLQMYKETGQMLMSHGVFGAGLSSYQHAMVEYHIPTITVNGQTQPVELYLYPHNIILNFWSEIGIFGLFSFLALLVFYFKECIKNIKEQYILFLFINKSKYKYYINNY